MTAAHGFEVGDVPSTLVLVELLKGLWHFAEASNGHLELRPGSRSPVGHLFGTRDGGIPFREIGDISDNREDITHRPVNRLRQSQGWHHSLLSVAPNESRISCVACAERSQMEFYHTRRATPASCAC